MKWHVNTVFLLWTKDLENEYGGGSRSNNDVEPQAKSAGVKHEEDLEEEEGGLCWKN